jgi:hypothetical protein
MSIRLELDEVAAAITERGAACFLTTVGQDGRPKIVHVNASHDGTNITVVCGRGSALNAQDRPLVTLLWPRAADQKLHLLIDGDATVTLADDGGRDGNTIRISPTSAIKHVAVHS